ncbi:hypothetical protein [Marinomonas sp.]
MGTLASLLQVDKLEVINQISHVPSVESPDQLTSLLKNFIS